MDVGAIATTTSLESCPLAAESAMFPSLAADQVDFLKAEKLEPSLNEVEKQTPGDRLRKLQPGRHFPSQRPDTRPVKQIRRPKYQLLWLD